MVVAPWLQCGLYRKHVEKRLRILAVRVRWIYEIPNLACQSVCMMYTAVKFGFEQVEKELQTANDPEARQARLDLALGYWYMVISRTGIDLYHKNKERRSEGECTLRRWQSCKWELLQLNTHQKPNHRCKSKGLGCESSGSRIPGSSFVSSSAGSCVWTRPRMEIDVKFSLALCFLVELSFFLLSLLADCLSYLSFVQCVIHPQRQ